MKNLLVLAMTAAMLGSAAAGTASAAVYPADFVGPLQEGDSREAGSAADPAAAIGGGLDQTLGAVGAAYANTDFEPGVTYDCSGGTCWLTKVYPEGSQYISSSWNMNYCEEDPECRDLLNAAKKKQQEREQKAAEEKAKAEEEKRKQAAAKKASDDAAKKALDDANKNMFGANSADASRDIPGGETPGTAKAADDRGPSKAGGGEREDDDPDLLAQLSLDPTVNDAPASGREDGKVSLAPPGAPPSNPLTGKLAKLTFSTYREKKSLKLLHTTAQETASDDKMADLDADKPEISGVLDRVAASLARFWDYNLMSPVKVDGPKHCGAQDAKCLKERVD